MINKILNFFEKSPTAFHAVDTIANELIENGYVELFENEDYKVEKGGKYFIRRNGSSIIGFNIGKSLNNPSLHVAASHTDYPLLKLKPEPVISSKDGCKFNIETYGGPLTYPWFDRPLSLAGRVMVKEDGKLKERLFDAREPMMIIPNMAPHLDRSKSEGVKVSPHPDLYPLVTGEESYDLKEVLSEKLGVSKENVLGFDLYVYPCQKPYLWGKNNEFFSCGHIDNFGSAVTTLLGFVNQFNDENINVYAAFDNEEVGSLTRQGADSNFLDISLRRITEKLGVDYYRLMAKGMSLSCDNGHALNINHPEFYDGSHTPKMNKGIVIKYNANQTYTSDGLSSSLFMNLLDNNNIKYQIYANKTGIRGGSTLGNLSNRHVSVITVDIGLPQLAMHSPLETAGSNDAVEMVNAVRAFYNAHLDIDNKGGYSL